MAKHVGIVACSAEGAALCYRTFCLEAAERMGRHDHPEVSMHTHSLAQYMAGIEAGDWAAVAELMLDSARRLAKIGAELLICPDNTIHQAMDIVEAAGVLPWLHIARGGGQAARLPVPDIDRRRAQEGRLDDTARRVAHPHLCRPLELQVDGSRQGAISTDVRAAGGGFDRPDDPSEARIRVGIADHGGQPLLGHCPQGLGGQPLFLGGGTPAGMARDEREVRRRRILEHVKTGCLLAQQFP